MRRLTIPAMVLALLVFAAPAAADELSLAQHSILPGESISYTIKVEEHSIIRETAIAKLKITTESECLVESAKPNQHFLSEQNFSEPTTETTSTNGFTELGTYQVCEYYRENEIGATNVTPKIIKTFKVVDAVTKAQEEKEEAEAAAKKKAEEAAKAKVEAETAAKKKHEEETIAAEKRVTEETAAAAKKHQEEEAAANKKREEEAKSKVSTKPLARTQLLANALKQCKKQYKHNKKKLGKCERQAKKKYGPKPKRRR